MSLDIVGVSHRYGHADLALDSVDLRVEPGEFLTLLGPSGCGKTTLLRIVGGFIAPTEGTVRLAGDDLTSVPPNRRPVNMVFQRPLLFPHLDVFGNVAFGLRRVGLGRDELARRVYEALELVRLPGYQRRRSHELSGGQMQRVALARALLLRPRVLLLDEPLSALDLKVRLEMEAELRRMHRDTRATFVYVTHDQREALALSDRVAVFDGGRLAEVATPAELYRRPRSVFAARFVGDTNVLPVDVLERNGSVATVAMNGWRGGATCDVDDVGSHRRGWLVVRPEAIRAVPMPADGRADGLRAAVHDVAFRGSSYSYRLAVDGMDTELKVEAPATDRHPCPVGSTVSLSWDPADGRVLARE
ncbi:ABC transporter ATP-binding protein [Pseudonocardia acaciae]|uniref:ABC transporter ATP-binding protein n=1 Tax=Pseudonocardia acaciae TaxID=551276 RepID=UPI00048CE67C|nr:ABC transporter ATP-binding protein [Pseudonocardia acaciae]